MYIHIYRVCVCGVGSSIRIWGRSSYKLTYSIHTQSCGVKQVDIFPVCFLIHIVLVCPYIHSVCIYNTVCTQCSCIVIGDKGERVSYC